MCQKPNVKIDAASVSPWLMDDSDDGLVTIITDPQAEGPAPTTRTLRPSGAHRPPCAYVATPEN